MAITTNLNGLPGAIVVNGKSVASDRESGGGKWSGVFRVPTIPLSAAIKRKLHRELTERIADGGGPRLSSSPLKLSVELTSSA
jgi:hypothetical protein